MNSDDISITLWFNCKVDANGLFKEAVTEATQLHPPVAPSVS